MSLKETKLLAQEFTKTVVPIMPPQNLWAAQLEKIPSVRISSVIHNPFEWRYSSPAAR